MAQHGLKALAVGVVGVGGFDHAAWDAGQHVLQRSRFTAPPAGDGGKHQRLAQQGFGQCRHEAQQRVGFQKTRARCVGHQDVAAAHRLQQARHTQGGFCAQLQRVQPVVVHTFEQAVHRLQTLQGFEVQLLIAHRQVVALHQAQTQIAGEVSMLKISFVVRAGGQERDVRRGTRWASGLDAVDQRAVGLGQTLHGHGLKGLRKLA